MGSGGRECPTERVAGKIESDYALDVDNVRYLAPEPPYVKEDGKWAVDYFPNGTRTEYGEYSEEEDAQRAHRKLCSVWKNGSGQVVVHRGPVVTLPK